MLLLSLAVAAIAPGIALLVYFYLKDKYVTEPPILVFKVFMIGVLLVFPTMVLQRGLYLSLDPPDWAMAFFLAGGVEESLKWFLVLYYIFRHKEFDEPYDGIVYAAALSLGFATMENVIYAFAYELSPQNLILRALLPVSGHALFGVMMGYYLGQAKFDRTHRRKYLIIALVLPIVWHGVFDYLFVLSDTYWIWLMLPMMAMLWIRGLRKVSMANERSPYRTMLREDDIPPSSS